LKEEVKEAVNEAISSHGIIPEVTSSADAWSSVGHAHVPTPPTFAPPPALTNQPYVHQISLSAEKTVPVPVEKLKLIQDSLQRSEHAISAALQNSVANATKLAEERKIVMGSINVISTITGESANHFKG
jgi:hypothetical protein